MPRPQAKQRGGKESPVDGGCADERAVRRRLAVVADVAVVWRSCGRSRRADGRATPDAGAGEAGSRASRPRQPPPAPNSIDSLTGRHRGAAGGAMGRGDRPLREGGQAEAEYVEGYWYQGTAYYTLDNFTECRETFRKVVRLAPKNGAAYAFLGLCEFGAQGLRPVAAAPAAVAHPRRRRHGGSRQRRALSRRHPDDADGAVRAGARNARRVRGRRGRQPAGDRGDGHRDAADADAADRRRRPSAAR